MSRKYAQLVELLEAQGVMQTDQPWAEPVIAFIKSNRKTGSGQQYRESAELDTLRTASQRLQADLDGEREAARDANADYLELQAANQRLEGEVKRLNSVLWAVSVQVDGNIRPTVRDLVNRLAGVNNGADPNDIYQYCDAIDAALRGNGGG